ncbi:hypothetical protein [Inquilinus sp. CAU 1745]|uniref:hypothetical protein n=1 Tax=Inquilinus sp. CAU 1745 TaxID=3140369 RepID=UPI00325ABE66
MSRIKTTAAGFALALMAATPAMAQEAYDDWDADANGTLEMEEFNTGFYDNGVFDSWDMDDDGLLSEDEFGEGVYNGYDVDDSGVLEEPEFGDYGDDLGDEGFWDV